MMADEILQALQRAGLHRLSAGETMSKHTSWRIGGAADYFCVAEDEQQLRGAVAVACTHQIPWLVLGGGNNILVSDQGIEGLVILNRLRGMVIELQRVKDATPQAAQVTCGAGVFFAKVAQYTARRGFTGMEWGIAVPGTVGGGVVNNAGAHWSDVSRTLLSADAVDAMGRQERFAPDDLAYRYRRSALKTTHTTQSQLVVTSCRFALQPDRSEAALARLEELRRHRLRTQPVKEASAGSTFTNPPGQHAGALIEQVGLKGCRVGGAQIALLHANFILNVDRAQAADVIALIRLAQQRVWEQFGVRLEPEIQFVGRWQDDDLRPILEAA